MENRLLFGTAYYPEYMPYERTDQDIAMMKAAGMNTVRITESTWSTLEPAEGIFDFSYIDRVLEKTEKAGMLVIVGTPTYAVPAWLVRKDPDIMAETSEGREKYGHRQIFDLLNPTFRKHAEIAFGGDSSDFMHTAIWRVVPGGAVLELAFHTQRIRDVLEGDFKP